MTELRKITELAMTFGEPVRDADPGELVMERIAAAAGHVRWLQSRVESLTEEEMVWNKTRDKVGGQDGGVTSEAKPHVWLELYERWSVNLTKLCVEAIKIGLKEREVRIAEAMGSSLVTMLDGLLVELGHDVHDPKTAAVVARHLRLVSEVTASPDLADDDEHDDMHATEEVYR